MTTENKKYLLLIIGAAFVLRFVGIWYGLPSLYNPGEPGNVMQALSYGVQKSLQPTQFAYPTLYSYGLVAVYGIYFIFGWMFGVFSNILDFGASYFLNPTGLFLTGRFLSVLLGILAVWVVYKIGRRFFSEKIALLSGLLITLAFIHVKYSHWIFPEAAVILMSALAVYFILRFHETPSLKTNVIAGIVSGLAISTKYSAGFIFVPLFLVSILHYRKDFGPLAKNFGVSAIALLLGFSIGTPSWLLSFSSFWDSFRLVSADMGYGYHSSIPFIWPLWELVAVDWTVGFLLVAGLIYASFQPDAKKFILLSFVLPTLIYAATRESSDVRYLLPTYPALIILSAYFLEDILRYLPEANLRAVILVLLFLPSLLKILHYDIQLTRKDTRAYAENWIEHHIDEGSRIAYENYVTGPNLFDPRRYIKDRAESMLLPVEIRTRLLQEKDNRISYNLINLRKDFRTVFKNDSLKKKFADNPFLRRYAENRLPGLSALRKARIEYLVISSDNYDPYLQGKPPQKERPGWLSYQNGRQFYQNVMRGEGLILLNEIKPTFWNRGPAIKIYKIKIDES